MHCLLQSDDGETTPGSSWVSSPILTREAEDSNDSKREEILDRPRYEDPLPHGVGSYISGPQPPKAPPRRRKQSPEEPLYVPEGSVLDETLSPGAPSQCSKPVVHSRTSSHSSGYEEGSSSLTETSDVSTWRDLIPRSTDRVEGLRWTDESANQMTREMESGCDTPSWIAKSDSSTTCDDDIQVFSPLTSLSVEEEVLASKSLGDYFASKGLGDKVSSNDLGEYFASKGLGDQFASRGLGEYLASKDNQLSAVTQPTEDALAPHVSSVTMPVPDARLSGCDLSDIRGGSLLSREDITARTETYISTGQKPRDTERESARGMLIKETDPDTFSDDEAMYVGEGPHSTEPVQCAVHNDSTNEYSSRMPFLEETSDVGLLAISSSPNNCIFNSSTSSPNDRDSLIPAVSDKALMGTGNTVDTKMVASIKDKPAVPRKPRNYGSRPQSLQTPKRSSSSVTNESAIRRSSQTEPETRGIPGRRKNVSFIVNDEDFGRYLSKPPGIEAKMVLPYTERQKRPDFPKQSDSVTSIGKSWTERHILPPKKPIFPGTNRRKESERPSSVSMNSQSVTKSTPVIRQQSDRWERLASGMSGTFRSRDSVCENSTKDPSTDSSAYPDLSGTTFAEYDLESIPKSVDDYLESGSLGITRTPYRDEYKSVARVSSGRRDSPERNSVSSYTNTSSDKRQDCPAVRVSNRAQRTDPNTVETTALPSHSRMSRSTTRDPTVRRSGTLPVQRPLHTGGNHPEISQREVETELAKKFEAFNARLAAMASAAEAKRSSRSTCSDTGRPFGSFQRGKWISSDSIFEGGAHDERKEASVFEGENESQRISENLLAFRETSNSQKGSLGAGTSRGILRSRSEAGEDMKTKYHSFMETRNRLASAYSKFLNRDGDSSIENLIGTNNSSVSTKTVQEQKRLSSSTADLNRGNSGDEFASRTPDSYGGSYTSLETSNTHRSGSERGLFRSHSSAEYDQHDLKPKKTLQKQGEELQRQFSHWHGLLLSEKSRSFFDHNEKQGEYSRAVGGASLSGSLQNCAPTSSEKTPVRMGTKTIFRRPPTTDRKVKETSWDPTKASQPWQTLDESSDEDRKELIFDGSLHKRLGGRPLRRSQSCVQTRTELFPRTAMAKFNDDGTPKSILKKSNSAARSESATDKAEEEPDDDDEDYGLNTGTEKDRFEADSPPLLHSPPPPPLPSSAPPDLPQHRRTALLHLIPSSLPSPQNLPVSPPTLFPSSQPPPSTSQTRKPPSFPPPLPPSSPPRNTSSFHPPTSPRRLSSLFSPTPFPPQHVSKSPSPQPLFLPSPPPLPSSSPPPPLFKSVSSEASSSAVSPSSDSSNSPSAWSPESGSSKFLGLQNLQKRSAILKKRSRSELGATASILDALNQR